VTLGAVAVMLAGCAAAAVCAAVLVVALLASGLFAVRGGPVAQQPQPVPGAAG
jgi:hypothetical protein